MCNKTYVIDLKTLTISHDNNNKFFCVVPMCLCCAIALQFPQRVVALFQKKTSISKPELFYWKICLVSLETAVFTPCIVILITVTAITGVCTWVGHPAWAITIDRCSNPVRHVSRITWHPPSKSSVSEYLRVITLVYFINCSQCEETLLGIKIDNCL